MGIYHFQDHGPSIHPTAYIAPSADIIGKVSLCKNTSVWHGTVIRGDVNEIKIGSNSNIQDLSALHVAADLPLIIGRNVTVGHNVSLHACKIADGCLIGIGAIVLDGAEIAEDSVVAAGAVVTPGKRFPPRSLIMGSPAKVIRELTDDDIEKFHQNCKRYIELAHEYQNFSE